MTKTTELDRKSKQNHLYETDFNCWLLETANLLRQGRLNQLDIDNLLEEIEAMGRSEKRSLESYLFRLFEHFLKLAYWESEREYNASHWRLEIANFRREIKKLLKDSPSLKPYLEEIFDECYLEAKKAIAKALKKKSSDFPDSIATLEQALDDDWFPIV
jgi:hypothetical protein